MTLYGYWRSTASWRVRLGLTIKGVPFDTVPIHLGQGAQLEGGFQAVNPQGFVPALTLDDGTTLTQSLAILEWLEETHPEPALLPADPIARAQVRAVAEVIACDVHPVQNLKVLKMLRALGQDQDGIDAWAARIIEDGLEACDALIAGQEGPFCFGDKVTMADVLLVPQLSNARRFGAELRWPRILEIEAACAELPAFKAAAPEAQPDFVP
ncbi:Maleylacetoacetate isomerase, MAAI (Glutathione S-transferase zeta 1, GSTZ1-1) [Sphingomonas antarctica]|uniref:maleylacetoacetate isomerase n=1 Tax=Sphingomonas antarctica TaxID=2040274 RepID=UPI0039EC68B9